MIILTYDVIAHRNKEIGASQPRKEGRRLWNVLYTAYGGRISLIVDNALKYEEPVVSEWLKREQFKVSVVDFTDLSGADNKLDRVRLLQSMFQRVDWYVDTDPLTIAKTLKEGIPSLLMAVPNTIRPEWEQEHETTKWSELTKELDKQALKKAERSWDEK